MIPLPRFAVSFLASALTLAVPGFLLARDIVIAGYNIENYSPILTPGRLKPGKSEEAAAAVVRAVKEINPDILGVCEMGSAVQFAEFRKRLTSAALGFTDFELVEASDPDRHLALLSRFPIVTRQSLTDVPYETNGIREKVKRGFLDVTLQINDRFKLRVVGAHLKSKLPSADAAQDLIRRNEAHLLRKHVSEIMAAEPGIHLVVFGDFNDTKDQAAVQEVLGRRGAPESLTDLAPADKLGDRWTHYWNVDDVYARIDYLLVNHALAPRVLRDQSYIYRSPLWNTASDHRPVVATIHIPGK